MQIVFITDLDGTLLGHDDFKFMPTKPGLCALLDAGIKIIPASSKTRPEIEAFCEEVGRRLPFIYENGAGIAHCDLLCDGEAGLSFNDNAKGLPVAELNTIWTEGIPADLTGLCAFIEEMDRPTQERLLGLSGTELDRAMMRSFSRPFVFTGSPDDFAALHQHAQKAGLSVQRGGRVCNLSGVHNKASYLDEIRRVTGQGEGPSVLVGFGDGENDSAMLNAVDAACIIPRPDGYILPLDKAGRQTYIAPRVAPWGWLDVAQRVLLDLSRHDLNADDRGVSYG